MKSGCGPWTPRNMAYSVIINCTSQGPYPCWEKALESRRAFLIFIAVTQQNLDLFSIMNLEYENNVHNFFFINVNTQNVK